MNKFRQLDGRFAASPQIDEADVAEAQSRGFAVIVNNRPEQESEGQTPGAKIEAAARAAGVGYTAIPVSHAGFSEAQVDALIKVMEQAEGPVLAYCRSGTRSTLLWALAQARQGESTEAISAKATAAGYDVTAVTPLMDMLRSRSRS